MSQILTRESFENAIRTKAAIGGSTNAVVHLMAIARRIGVDLSLDDWDRLGRNVHCLLDLMPSGRYLMEDFFEAGGLPAILNQLGEQNLLHLSALTVNGRTLGENIAQAPCWRPEVVHSYNEPFKANAGISVLRGNLAPNGARSEEHTSELQSLMRISYA